MKTTTIPLTCHFCSNLFLKCKREYARQVKRGRTYFFCKQSCSTKHCNSISPPKGNIANLRTSSFDEFSPFRYYVRKAKDRDHETDLDVVFLRDLWAAQDGKCVYSGITLIPNMKTSGQDPRFQASLDRIDSSVPYKRGNVQFVATPLNFAKSTMTDEMMREFIEIIKSTSK